MTFYDLVQRVKRLAGYGAIGAAVATTTLHPQALDVLKHFEGGCSGGTCESYIDPVGVPTIGHGHTNAAGTVRFQMGDVWTEEYALEVLDQDLEVFWNAIGEQVTVPLTQCQQSVLTSWAFNVGTGATARSTLVRLLNDGQYDQVPAQLMRWNKGRVRGELVELPGLTRRRAAEGDLWVTNCGENP